MAKNKDKNIEYQTEWTTHKWIDSRHNGRRFVAVRRLPPVSAFHNPDMRPPVGLVLACLEKMQDVVTSPEPNAYAWAPNVMTALFPKEMDPYSYHGIFDVILELEAAGRIAYGKIGYCENRKPRSGYYIKKQAVDCVEIDPVIKEAPGQAKVLPKVTPLFDGFEDKETVDNLFG